MALRPHPCFYQMFSWHMVLHPSYAPHRSAALPLAAALLRLRPGGSAPPGFCGQGFDRVLVPGLAGEPSPRWPGTARSSCSGRAARWKSWTCGMLRLHTPRPSSCWATPPGEHLEGAGAYGGFNAIPKHVIILGGPLSGLLRGMKTNYGTFDPDKAVAHSMGYEMH